MVKTRNILLYPVSLIYGFITGFRNFLYNYGILSTTVFPVPVICVGNITVGGTGKTPHTEYLVELLEKNFKVATLSRGYKRKTGDFRIASLTSTVNEIGDEPMQIFRKFPSTLVAVDRKRVNGVRKILKASPDTDIIILDDGFQHRSITPGFSILLSDFERPLIKDHMLPYGDLREYKSNMRRADVILITKCPENLSAIQRRLFVKEIEKAPYQNLYFTSLSYGALLPVFNNADKVTASPDLRNCKTATALLLTGIANPKSLREYLENFFNEIIDLRYTDHYSFTDKDISDITTTFKSLTASSKYILTTEKDAVRLREFTNMNEDIKSALFYIPIGINFLNDDKTAFDNLIIDYVRKNKSNIRISKS